MCAEKYKRDDYLYQPFYCEENIWHLCQKDDFKKSFVVFISSEGSCFPMLKQRLMTQVGSPIVWDYHVVLLVPDLVSQILDFDTSLPFSTDVKTYFNESFISTSLLGRKHIPLFKVIPSSEFVRTFASDRSHMKTKQGWSAPPPSWPMIGDGSSNLSQFTNMDVSRIGEVLTAAAFVEKYTEL